MGISNNRARRPLRPLCAEDLEWRVHAECRGLPTEMFFTSEGERGARRAAGEERAKRICRVCRVRSECLRFAVALDEPYGIWGAMTPRERRWIAADVEDGREGGQPLIS